MRGAAPGSVQRAGLWSAAAGKTAIIPHCRVPSNVGAVASSFNRVDSRPESMTCAGAGPPGAGAKRAVQPLRIESKKYDAEGRRRGPARGAREDPTP